MVQSCKPSHSKVIGLAHEMKGSVVHVLSDILRPIRVGASFIHVIRR